MKNIFNIMVLTCLIYSCQNSTKEDNALASEELNTVEEQSSSVVRILDRKDLPTPTTVSAGMQEAINAPAPLVPVPANTEEWIAMQTGADAAGIDQAKALAEQLGVNISQKMINGVNCYVLEPSKIPTNKEGRLLMHLHGGAYVFGGNLASAIEGIMAANATQSRVVSVDYRMPPNHPYPAALEDAVSVWKFLANENNPSKMGLLGTSAGAGLLLATIQKLKQDNAPMPSVLFAGSPWSDLSKTGDSYYTNAGLDNALGQYDGFLEAAAKIYAGSVDLQDPGISPVYGDFIGFPPTILISGTRDLFLSNTVRVHRKLREANVVAELHVFEGQSHGDYVVYGLPENAEAYEEVALFFDSYLK